MSAPGASEPLALVARGDRAAVMRADRAEFWRYQNGYLGLEASVLLNMPPSTTYPSWCVSYSPPSRLIAVDVSDFISPVVVDGTQVLQLAARLSDFTGADDHGAWWSDGVELFAGQPELSSDAGVIFQTPFQEGVEFGQDCPESESTPIFAVTQRLPFVSAGSIYLEKFPSTPGPLFGANSRLVWGMDDGGTVFWWDR